MPQPRISSQSSPSPKADLALVAPALDVDLERRLGERKERGPEPHVDVIDLEERLAELVQDPFEVAEMRALVDDEALDLVKLRRVGGVGIDAIGAARADDADRRLLRQHGAHLHRRGVGPQQHARAVFFRIEEERVVHFPRRMAFGEIQLGEVVVVGLDIGAFGDRKSHVGEDRRQFIHHLAERMNAALLGGRLAHRQRDVDGLGGEPRVERRRFQDVAARGERLRHRVLGEIDRRALASCVRPATSCRALPAGPRSSPSCRALRRARLQGRLRRRRRRSLRGWWFELSEVGHGDGHLLGTLACGTRPGIIRHEGLASSAIPRNRLRRMIQ
jgi:hypothetical protein